MLALLPGLRVFGARLAILRRTLEDPGSYLRDELEIIPRAGARGGRPELVA